MNPWRMARLTWRDQYVLLWGLVLAALLRAGDYLIGDDEPVIPKGHDRPRTSSLTVLESAFGITWWAIAILVGALVLAVGMLTRRHLAVWIGHAVLGTIYTALFASSLLSALDRPWADGIRAIAEFAIVGWLHWLMWLRTGPEPLPDEDSVVAETTREAS